jgi:serpin B
MRKSLFILACAAAVLSLALTLMAGCGGTPVDDQTTTTTETSQTTVTTAATQDEVQLAASDLTRVSASAPRADILSASAGMNAFGADLYGVLAKTAGNGNLVFSPASIETALAMVYAGAAGDTAKEMAVTLHFQLQGDALHQGFNSLDTLLESRSWQGGTSNGRTDRVLVKTANSLWAEKDLAIEKLFLDTLAKDYGAGVRLVDFQTAAEDARTAINKWVADQTADKITDLIPEGALDGLTRLVLVNAVYLDATWQSPFNKEATHDGSFHTLAGTDVTAPTMEQMSGFSYGKGDGWQAVELPYSHDELAMLVIVPDAGSFADVEGRLRDGLIDEAVAALTNTGEVDLSLPKFKFRTQSALSDALRALGMRKAFDGGAADFSGITKQQALSISDVIHEAYIAVDEDGTEAAAATAVALAGAMPGEPVKLAVDRPFIFALRDKDTGAVLFLGRVTDPTA